MTLFYLIYLYIMGSSKKMVLVLIYYMPTYVHTICYKLKILQ